MSCERQTGRSHKQVIEALTRLETERFVYYLITPGTSVGYYLNIACQILWGSKKEYRVAYSTNQIIFDDGKCLRFNVLSERYFEHFAGLRRNQLVLDHHLQETMPAVLRQWVEGLK